MARRRLVVAALTFGVPFALVVLAASALWPRAPRAAAALWALGLPAFLLAFWDAPGFVPGFFGLAMTFFPLRAWSAALEAPELSRARYVGYVLDFTQVLPAQERPAPPAPEVARRLRRGLALAALAAAMIAAGYGLQLWRRWPFLEDLYVVVEVAVTATAACDLIAALHWWAGRPLPDLHDVRFAQATSLRDFWRRWNGAVSLVLGAALFQPIARRRRQLGPRLALALGALAAFAGSGLLHAFPLLVASEDRRTSLILAGATLAFFLLHGLGAVIEGAFPRAWRGGWPGRLWVCSVFVVAAPLYPGPLAALFGMHGRTYESMTVMHLLRALER